MGVNITTLALAKKYTDEQLASIKEGAAGSESFVVNVTGDDNNGYAADKTYFEIEAAHNNGKIITSRYSGNIYPLRYIGTNGYQKMALFNTQDEGWNNCTIGVFGDGTVVHQTQYLSDIYQATSDYSLKTETKTIVGAINEINSKLPTDEHINELINTALGVIENGSY